MKFPFFVNFFRVISVFREITLLSQNSRFHEKSFVGPEVQVKGPLTSISGGNGSTHPRQPEVRQMTVPTEVHGTEDRQDADAVFRIHRETIDEAAAEVVDNFR